jgi:uncharacterized metal-binding protein YceD (DUF177 family)
MHHPLELSLSVLQEKGKTRFDGTVQPEAFQETLGNLAKLLGPLTVGFDAMLEDGAVLIKGRAAGKWELECCRCLTRKAFDCDVKIETVIEEPPPTIDALEEIRQILLLAVPTQSYCRPDCRGLCPQCGTNRNEKDCGCIIVPPSRFKITKRGKTDA